MVLHKHITVVLIIVYQTIEPLQLKTLFRDVSGKPTWPLKVRPELSVNRGIILGA